MVSRFGRANSMWCHLGSLAWRQCYGFQPPEIQTEFRDGKGVMYVDFYWPGLRLVIEYDGEGNWTDAAVGTGTGPVFGTLSG